MERRDQRQASDDLLSNREALVAFQESAVIKILRDD